MYIFAICEDSGPSLSSYSSERHTGPTRSNIFGKAPSTPSLVTLLAGFALAAGRRLLGARP